MTVGIVVVPQGMSYAQVSMSADQMTAFAQGVNNVACRSASPVWSLFVIRRRPVLLRTWNKNILSALSEPHLHTLVLCNIQRRLHRPSCSDVPNRWPDHCIHRQKLP